MTIPSAITLFRPKEDSRHAVLLHYCTLLRKVYKMNKKADIIAESLCLSSNWVHPPPPPPRVSLGD